MQFLEDCTRTSSPPPPLLSLSPVSLALCLAGYSPGQAQSRSGPVDTSCSTTSATSYKNDWVWTSWAWTYITAAVSSRKSTSMSGWVYKSDVTRLPTWANCSSHRVFLSNSCTHGCVATALEFNNNLQRHAPSVARISSRNWTSWETQQPTRLIASPQYLNSLSRYSILPPDMGVILAFNPTQSLTYRDKTNL